VSGSNSGKRQCNDARTNHRGNSDNARSLYFQDYPHKALSHAWGSELKGARASQQVQETTPVRACLDLTAQRGTIAVLAFTLYGRLSFSTPWAPEV
jgi:hypothetical protein